MEKTEKNTIEETKDNEIVELKDEDLSTITAGSKDQEGIRKNGGDKNFKPIHITGHTKMSEFKIGEPPWKKKLN